VIRTVFHSCGFSVAAEGVSSEAGRSTRNAVQDGNLFTHVQEFPHRNPAGLPSTQRVNLCQLFRIAEGERMQQKGVYETEDCRVRSDR